MAKSPLAMLVRVGDLVHIEGPMLVLYQNRHTGNLFLCDWVDRDEENNRWLVYKTTALALYNFIRKAIPCTELFKSKYTKGEFWPFDMSGNLTQHNFLKMLKHELPADYLPKPEAFFEISDCPSLSMIESFVAEAMSSEIEKKIWHEFDQIKSREIKEHLFNSIENSITMQRQMALA